MNSKFNNHILIKEIKYVGTYEVNKNLFFSFKKKPNWFHRKMTKILLGWNWKDSNTEKK